MASNISPTEIIDVFDPSVKWKSSAEPKLKWLFNTEFNSHSNNPGGRELEECRRIYGGLVQNKLIICSGHYYYILGTPMIKKVLIEPRNFASSVVLNDNVLWIVGGKVGKNNTNTSEFVKLNENPVKGPDLPFHISHHSMIQYDKKSIYIIGGLYDDDKYGSGQTWITDPTNGFQIIKGPNLKEPRHSFACGKMLMNGKTVLIVAGGITKLGNVFDSVEILDPSSDKGWKIGMKLIIISIEIIQWCMESNSYYYYYCRSKITI